jgi:hypothetical protein
VRQLIPINLKVRCAALDREVLLADLATDAGQASIAVRMV